MSLRVAPLEAADLAAYRRLMLHAYAAAPDAFSSTPEERAAEPESWWLRRIGDDAGLARAFGADLDGELVGTVTVEFYARPKTRHKAHVVGMFVLESSRGAGAGAALLGAALAHAKARPGIEVATLTVTEGNRSAIALYERHGFRTFGVEPMAIRTPAGYRGKVHMWLPIGEAAGGA